MFYCRQEQLGKPKCLHQCKGCARVALAHIELNSRADTDVRGTSGPKKGQRDLPSR